MRAARGKNTVIKDPVPDSTVRQEITAPRADPSRLLNLLRTRSAQFDAALSNMPHGLCMFDASRQLILCNAAYVRLYNLPPRLTLPGTPLVKILEFRQSIHNAPQNLETYFDVVHEALEKGQFASTRVELQDGRTIQITHNPMVTGGYVATHEDVSAQVLAEKKISYLATHDHLTGLWNRNAFLEKLDNALLNAGPADLIAVHCLDLDQFKPVNDLHGHPTGDRVLQLVAERFTSSTAESGTVGRLGGDEFGILQTSLDSPADAGSLAGQLIKDIRRPFSIDKNKVTIGVSIGIALWPRNGSSADELLRSADIALYRAKIGGKNAFEFA